MTPIDLYLDLLAKALTRALFEDNDAIAGMDNSWDEPSLKRRVGHVFAPVLSRAGFELVRKRPYDPKARELGRDWPARAESMAGLRRMANARHCIESVLAQDVPGDVIETGVWRGGMSIFMRGVLKAHDVSDRRVWLADSFEGLPLADATRYPADVGDNYNFDYLSSGVGEVRRNFARYGLLDDQVQFLIGWFKNTLRDAPMQQIAVLRLDGDMYESTIQALEPLYPKLSPGGFCIVDDYGNIEACRRAVHDYRDAHEITDDIIDVDGWAVYWQKS